jgi:hypothetical protein
MKKMTLEQNGSVIPQNFVIYMICKLNRQSCDRPLPLSIDGVAYRYTKRETRTVWLTLVPL